MTFLDMLTVLVLVLPIIDWVAVWALHRFHRWYPQLVSIRERKRVATAIALLTTVFAILALARLGHVELNDNLAAGMITGTITLLSLVNAAFLLRYRHALFGKPPHPPED